MQIAINNTAELLEFIKRDEVTATQATEVVCTALNLINIFEKSKAEVIETAEYSIKTFYQDGQRENPIFFDQLNDDFSITDVFKNPECRKIIDDLEAKY